MAPKYLCVLAALSAVAVLSPGAGDTPAPPVALAAPGHAHVLRAAPGDLDYAHGPKLASRTASRPEAPSAATANLSVVYSGFSAQAQAAFQAAVDIWAATIVSPAPIRVRAFFTPLEEGVLGSAGATVLCKPSGGVANTWYPAALADKINGGSYCAALGGETAEIEAHFNSSFTAWEYGTSGTGVSGKYSFMTVVLHEIGHGLGFFGGFTSTGGIGDHFDTAPFIYDRFAVSGGGTRLLSLARPSATLHAQLVGNNTFVDGTQAMARNGGVTPKLETHEMTGSYGIDSDNGWAEGSSYSHIDDLLYSGTPNGLMTYALNSNEVYTDVGPIVKGMFEDQGWTISEGVPGTPTLTAPIGTTSALVPDFVWVPVSGAQSYDLYVEDVGAGSVLINGSYPAGSYCSSTACSVRAPTTLNTSSSHAWRVRARNGAGPGAWASATFTVEVGPPAKPVLTSPSGSIGSATPTFTWQAVSGAATYELFVTRHGNSTPVINATLSAAAVCAGASCSQVSPVQLTAGATHEWWVRAAGDGGTGPWSSSLQFVVSDLPGPTTVVAPSGSAVPMTPVYSWNAVTKATWYFLSVVPNGSASEAGTWYQSSAVCGATTCSIAASEALAPSSTYSVQVRTWNTHGYGPWSAKVIFTTAATPLLAPTGATATPAPGYRWLATDGADGYRLWVQRGGVVVIQQTFTSSICAGGTCSVTPRSELADGAHSWWVQPQFGATPGSWSPAGEFSVTAGIPPAASPSWPSAGVAGATRPVYRWTAVPSATWYYLWVTPAAGGAPVVQTWYFGGDVCAASGCAVIPNVPLSAGQSYYWWVQTWSSRGDGPWSAGTLFTLPTTAPPAATLVAPKSAGTAATPTYTWTHEPSASWYYLWVSPLGRGPVIQQWFRADEVCSGTACAVTPSVALPAGDTYTFWVQTWNDLGTGPFSAGMQFSR